MPLWRSWDDVPSDLPRSAVVIGNFDGVHLGHRAVLRRACEVAADRGLRVVAVTFDPHPMQVLLPERAPVRLTDLETRAALLQDAGAHDVLVLPFDREMASWSPEEFVRRVLVERLRAAVVLVGENFRFGHRAAGDVAALRGLGERHDFVVEGLELTGADRAYSSTAVRQALAEGEVDSASAVLGRPVAVTGRVVRGDQRGRELGYPTANVPVEGEGAGMVPADGVYAGWLRVQGEAESLPAAISVGTNPTFAGERARRVEAYVLDHHGLDLYDREVEVAFVGRVRGMERFDSVEELVAQMDDDVRRTRDLLGTPAPEDAPG